MGSTGWNKGKAMRIGLIVSIALSVIPAMPAGAEQICLQGGRVRTPEFYTAGSAQSAGAPRRGNAVDAEQDHRLEADVARLVDARRRV